MTKKTCKHNRMSEVLPGLWIGGSRKHTEEPLVAHEPGFSKLRLVTVVEKTPVGSPISPLFKRFFVCPNYGIPNVSLEWWAKEVLRYNTDSLDGMATVVTDLGGHGRSGLYCAIIMVHVLGITGSEAIFRLRRMHCEQAVETPEQEAYVVRIADELRN